MSASVHGPGGRAWLRYALALIVIHDLCIVYLNFFYYPPPDYPIAWTPGWLLTIGALGWPIVVLLALAGVGTVGFCLRERQQLWFGLFVLVCLAVLVEAMGAHVGQPRRRFYSTGAMLAGWCVGLIVGRARGAELEHRERLGEAGAAAALAATYFNAGIQKLLAGGLVEARTMQAHIFTHHHIDDTSVLGQVAFFVAEHSDLGVAIGLSVIVVQLGSLTYIVSRRMRMIWGTALIAFHLGTLVFIHIIYLSSAVMLLVWSYPWARIHARVTGRALPPKQAPEMPPLSRAFMAKGAGIGVAFVVLMWWIPTPGERDPRAARRPSYAWVPVADEDPAPNADEPPSLARFGSLERGAELGTWRIERLWTTPGRLNVECVRDDQRVRFGASGPAGDAPAGPHSVGTLRIFYSAPEQLEPSEFDDAGLALRAALESAASEPGPALDAQLRRAAKFDPTD